MDYLKFYDLDLEPFKNDLNSRFYFESDGQRRARLRLLRCVEQKKGLSVLIGGPGCGKTTLANHLRSGLDEERWAVKLIVVPHSACAHGWLLPQLSTQFGVDSPSDHIPQLLDQIGARLAEVREAGQHPVLFVDEAQLFRNTQAMEELRGLLNFVHVDEKLISIVLFGLPELSDVIALDPPLEQRIDVRVELRAMEREEAAAYIQHRLGCAGGTESVLSNEAIEALYRYSSGVPRVLNTLADNALFEGFLAESTPLDASIVADAADDLGLRPGDDSRDASRVDPPAAPYVEGSLSASFASRDVPPLPAASASAVALELPTDEDGSPAEVAPSSWESELWEEPSDDDPDGLEFAGFPSTAQTDDDSNSGESERAVGDGAAEREGLDAKSEDPDFDLEELLDLPADESPEESPEPADSELELEISPMEDDGDEVGFEEVAGNPEPVEVEGTVESDVDPDFDLGSLLADVDEEAETVAEPFDLGEPATAVASDDDDFETLFDAIQLD